MTAAPPLLKHATWDAQTTRRDQSASELSTAEALRLVDDLSAASTALLRIRVDASPRADLLAIAGHAVRSGMDVVIEIDDIQRFDRAYLRQVKRAGVRRIAAAIDDVDSNPGNPNPDSFVPPTERDIFLDDLEEVGLLFEAQTHLTATNVGWLDQIAASLEKRRVSRWLVSVCVRQPFALPTRSVEKAIQKLAKIASRVPFPIATRHAPLFLRLCHEAGGTGRIEDERHGIYIDNDGRIYPDPSVELSLGNIRERSLIDIIRNHPVLRALRQPESIEGKCGVCVFNNRCGGSRVRAFNLRGSLFASDPSCEFVGLEERHDELTPHRL